MRPYRWSTAALAAGVVACASPAPAPTQAAPSNDPMAPLTALPACASAPPTAAAEPVDGLVLPVGSVVVKVEEQDPLTTVTAFTPFTPAQFEATYGDMPELTVLLTENEVFEAELLISNGEHRNFLKATATCSTGSNVLAVVAPEVDAEGLPLPQGAATAPPAP